jgi:hypothetical protein
MVDNMASTSTLCWSVVQTEYVCCVIGWRLTHDMRVAKVADDVASTGTQRGGRLGLNRYAMWCMTWQARVNHVVNDAASTSTRCG